MHKNTGITLVDVRSEALEAIRMVKEGKMEVKTASEIRNLLNTIIDTAKVQVDFLNAVPKPVKDMLTVNGVKAIAGTLVDRDAELDSTMHEIRDRRSKPLELGGHRNV